MYCFTVEIAFALGQRRSFLRSSGRHLAYDFFVLDFFQHEINVVFRAITKRYAIKCYQYMLDRNTLCVDHVTPVLYIFPDFP